MFNLFRKKHKLESILLSDLLTDFNFSDDYEYFLYKYRNICPVKTVTRLIVENSLEASYIVEDKSSEILYDHEFLKLLDSPNYEQSKFEFLEEAIISYILTGNIYLNVIYVSGKPAKLDIIDPRLVHINYEDNSKYPKSYDVDNSNYSNIKFNRTDSGEYLDSLGNQLFHLKNYNSDLSNKFYGESLLSAAQLEIEQYYKGCVYNWALLCNQARPSMAMIYKGDTPLSKQELDLINSDIKERLTGSSNAGKPIIIGGNFEIKEMSRTLKDMEFTELKKSAVNSICSCLLVPSVLIQNESSTFNNLSTARYILYQNTVLPILNRLCYFFNKVLAKFEKNLRLTIDLDSISTLRENNVNDILKIAKSGVLTVNEIRSRLGYDKLQGGDEIHSINSKTDNSDDIKDLANTMLEIKDIEGNSVFTKDDIILSCKDIYDNNI